MAFINLVNPIALRMAKTLWSFGHSECNRVKHYEIISAQELEVWFLHYVWCPAPMSPYTISSKWLPMIFIQMFMEYLRGKIQVPVISVKKMHIK